MKLLFYKGRKAENPSSGIWDNIICWVTNSQFSHVEIALGETTSHYNTWSSSNREIGVRETWIFKNRTIWTEVDIDEDPAPVLRWFEKHKGEKYDWIGLIGTRIHLKYFRSNNKWFCSEAIADALDIENSWKMTPEKLYLRYT